MFAVIRHYHFDPKNSDAIGRAVRDDFVPIIRKAKGFVRYYWLDTGNGEGASFGVFQDKAGADESCAASGRVLYGSICRSCSRKSRKSSRARSSPTIDWMCGDGGVWVSIQGSTALMSRS